MRARLEINLNFLKENCLQFIHLSGKKSFFCPMIKANAYGCGATEIAKALNSIGVKKLGVICLEEALEIKDYVKDTEIFIFGPLKSEEILLIQKHGFIPVIGNWNNLKQFSKLSEKKSIPFHIKFNTGMNRIGFPPSDKTQLMEYIHKNPFLNLQGLASHLSEGETAGRLTNTGTRQQIHLFQKICHDFLSFFPSLKPQHCHLLSSTGWWALWSHSQWKNDLGFRPGLCLYGLKPPIDFQSPSAEKKYQSITLKPVLCLKAYIVQSHQLQTGQTVSYGNTWKTDKPSVVAVVSMGYADGLPHSLSNKGFVLFRGKRSPIVGRVCMDFFMTDVTEAVKEKSVQPGEEVVIFGSQQSHFLSIQEQAEQAGSIPYELLARLGKRVTRVYKE